MGGTPAALAETLRLELTRQCELAQAAHITVD
jgi:hypothetical protein